jgi:hypothetical protein
MISYLAVLPMCTAACLSYAASIEAAAVNLADGEYVHMGYFVAHLIRLLDDGDTRFPPPVVDVVESVLGEGDPEARSLISFGLLQDLTSLALYQGKRASPTDFLPWLGPRAFDDSHVHSLLEERLLRPRFPTPGRWE